MGMFDTIRSSYNLGEQFTNVELQTKDIEDYGISGTMSHYWIDKAGYLYLIDYANTADFIQITEEDPEYNSTYLWLNFKWVSNGTKGKVRPHLITKYISVYPSRWDGDYTVWPTLKLHLKCGKVVEYEDITGRKYD